MPDLATLPDGTRVFVDTNIFHFHFQGKSQTCTAFLTRIAHGEVEAYVNTQVLSDLIHKLMLKEAIAKNCMSGTNPQGLKKYLKECRGKISALTEYQTQFEAIMAIGLHVIRINKKLLIETKKERKNYYLMTGDSLHIGSMNRHKTNKHKTPLRDIVTDDHDFDHIPGLTVWQPTDVIW